ncbi:pirin family protein [Photobacterium minamisatsumaniensis]|uniref:pirin family protein n=1 Tax=Photobacterium minamisatsumaniensis TaxID=2910233 RepID=UPI003D11B58D
MDKLQKSQLSLGGFAGLTEHRLIKSPQAFGGEANQDGSWPGLGNFVYLADAQFLPKGETRMHSHHEVDVISVMVKGRIAHQGSLGHGKDLNTYDVQVQRAGGEGFSHNEVNPDDSANRMIQLWVLPEQTGQPAAYKVYRPQQGEMTRIYGGTSSHADFPASTIIDTARLSENQSIKINAPFIAYLVEGEGKANNEKLIVDEMIRGTTLNFTAEKECQLIIIQLATEQTTEH